MAPGAGVRLLIILANLLAWMPLFFFIRRTRRDLRWMNTPLTVLWLVSMAIYLGGEVITDHLHFGNIFGLHGWMAYMADLNVRKRYKMPSAHDLTTLNLSDSTAPSTSTNRPS